MVCAGNVRAHHGTSYFFDTSKSITLEGEIVRVEWVNPHRRLHIQSTNEKGERQTWVLWGSSNFTGPGAVELKERLQPGVLIVARGFPSRFPGTLEAGVGEIRFPNGDVETFGGGPTF
jgi:hypothetical protein